MGTASTTKYIKNSAGSLAEEPALITSAGAADTNRLPALNASGILDDTIINASATGVANKIAKLDGNGRLDITMMPTGIAADTVSVVSSENLVAGDLVNIYNNGGVGTCRKADASAAGKEAHGYVLAATTSPAAATVYFEGSNTQMTSLTPGRQYLSATTPGKTTVTAPSAATQVVQTVGFATSATSMNFQSGTPVVLA